WVGATRGMKKGDAAALIESVEIRERRVQAEERVEWELRAGRNLHRRAARVVERVADRHDSVGPAGGPALEDRPDPRLGPRRSGPSQPGGEQKGRHADGGR